MRAIEYINKLDREDFRIERCRLKIERLETLAENRSSKPFDNDRVKSSGSKDRIGDLAIKIMEEQERLERLIAENEERREFIEEQIDKIPDIANSKIIYYHHIEKMNYSEIADMLDLSPKTVRNNHSDALKQLDKILLEHNRTKKDN